MHCALSLTINCMYSRVKQNKMKIDFLWNQRIFNHRLGAGRQAKYPKIDDLSFLVTKLSPNFSFFLCFWPADIFIWLIISWVNRHIQVQRCLLWLADYKMPKKLKVAGCVQLTNSAMFVEYFKPNHFNFWCFLKTISFFSL